MAAVPLVVVLEAAAEAYAKELAASIGTGIVETLFNQGKIASDLAEIKQMLMALSEFIRLELPLLVERSVDIALAKKLEYEVIEKALTVRGSIASLQAAREVNVPEWRLQFLVSELAFNADGLFEMAGALTSYGQPYYASVGVAFGLSLKAYASIAVSAPERFASLYLRCADWQPRLTQWMDISRSTSLAGSLKWYRERYELGQRTVPSFETWNTHTTREVLISWQRQGDVIWLFGAWYGYWQGTGLNGNMLSRCLAEGQSVEQAMAAGALRYTIPEWYEVKADVIASRADYDQCAEELKKLIADYYRYPVVEPNLVKANHLIASLLATIDKILLRSEVIIPTTAQELGMVVTETIPTPEQHAERFAQAAKAERIGYW
ncbi:hypothetical protein KW842_20895 [Duganella sp. sic0402]|uniref:hypothetical protein n=1 Tax=Duganella sp. sic0402 TaxID=2854786 RepID=UPI001C49326C|nr:hypothetical protein [Duganella sp. sic0402]MBV7538237.1 hypothetical protein [Duganella sp. sic0402]